MDINVFGRHLEVTDPIREYAHGKAEKLPKFFDRVNKVEVLLNKVDNHTFGAEFIVHVDGADHIVAHGSHEDLYACIDETNSKIERQLHDLKEKRRNHKHPA